MRRYLCRPIYSWCAVSVLFNGFPSANGLVGPATCALTRPISNPIVRLCTHTTRREPSTAGYDPEKGDWEIDSSPSSSRRAAIASLLVVGTATLSSKPAHATATTTSYSDALENLAIAQGQWTPFKEKSSTAADPNIPSTSSFYSATFCSYAVRFLIHYDDGVQTWWNDLRDSLNSVSFENQQATLSLNMAKLARSVQLGLGNASTRDDAQHLYDEFQKRYGTLPDARRHIGILFALLPPSQQPLERLKRDTNSVTATTSTLRTRLPRLSNKLPNQPLQSTTLFGDNLTRLLPPVFSAQPTASGCFGITPPVNLYQVGSDEGTATAFGFVYKTPLTREIPRYSPWTYGLFGLSGATGCALTHTVVIPLDVVKTRAQTDAPSETGGGNLVEAGKSIVKNEGIQGLLLGAQATIAGYFWYGLSVYPSYTYFKRYLKGVAPLDYVVSHGNEIALLAGALAAVVASLGLTPLEAARIRVVADPDRYRPLGLSGTLGVIASEGQGGLQNLYAGLPSLLTRQVIFGSIKFLAFERASEAIFYLWPILREETWTALAVSLAAGGLSGVLSSAVSQPADSILTYVAKNDSSENTGILDGAREMVQQEGVGSLFRGLGSRCVWAGSIIAGQFLLYDVFRTLFSVSADDLSQVYRIVIPEN